MTPLFLIFTVVTIVEGSQVSFASSIHGTGEGIPGSVDLYWTLKSSPYPSTSAYIAMAFPGVWYNSTHWIGLGSNLNTVYAQGHYVYQTTFSIPSNLDPSTTTITGYCSADDSVDSININGVSTGLTCASYVTIGYFTIDSSHANFVAGNNTLQVRVSNSGGPTGLLVSFSSAVADALITSQYLTTDGIIVPFIFLIYQQCLLLLLRLSL